MRTSLLSAPIVFAVLLAACGSSNDSTPTPTPAPTVDFPAEARRVVPDAVLTPDDLPGFIALDAGDLSEQAGLSEECDIFDAGTVFPDAVAAAESEPYLGPLDQQVLNHAAVYRTTDGASAGLASTQDVLDRCEDEFRDTVERIARDELERLGIDLGFFATINITIGPYDPPAAGDEILGYRMNVDVDLVVTRQQYNIDVIIVREGRVAGALMYGLFGAVNPETEAMLLAAVIDRLAAAERDLPE